MRLVIPLLIGASVFGQAVDPQLGPSTGDLDVAKSYIERSMLTEAEMETRQFLQTHRNSAKAHFLLGYILYRQTKARDSLSEYTEGAKYEKPSANDLSVVGADYVLLNDYSDADKWFTKATQWEPGNVLDWYFLGRTKYNENRFEEAVSAFERCLKLDMKNVRAQDNLGLSLQALGRSAEAREAFLKSISWQAEASKKDPWPYIDMGSFLLESNEAEQAIPYFKQALAIAPDSAKAHQQLGKAYLSMQQLADAQKELEQSAILQPDDARAHYVLGQLYAKEGQKEKARQEFAKYSKLNSAHSDTESQEHHLPAPN